MPNTSRNSQGLLRPLKLNSHLTQHEGAFLTMCEDGFVRTFSLKPTKILRIIDQREEYKH